MRGKKASNLAFQRELARSIKALRIEINSKSPEKAILHDLASLYYLSGQYKPMLVVLKSSHKPTLLDLFLINLAYSGLKDTRNQSMVQSVMLKLIQSRWPSPVPVVSDESYKWDHYLKVGIQHKLRGRYFPATVALKHAIKLNPNFEKAYIELGRTYVLMNKLKDAITAYRQALRINFKSPHTLYSLGVALKNAGELGGAFEMYQFLDKQDAALAYKLLVKLQR